MVRTICEAQFQNGTSRIHLHLWSHLQEPQFEAREIYTLWTKKILLSSHYAKIIILLLKQYISVSSYCIDVLCNATLKPQFDFIPWQNKNPCQSLCSSKESPITLRTSKYNNNGMWSLSEQHKKKLEMQFCRQMAPWYVMVYHKVWHKIVPLRSFSRIKNQNWKEVTTSKQNAITLARGTKGLISAWHACVTMKETIQEIYWGLCKNKIQKPWIPPPCKIQDCYCTGWYTLYTYPSPQNSAWLMLSNVISCNHPLRKHKPHGSQHPTSFHSFSTWTQFAPHLKTLPLSLDLN